jgi:hypothetical protein
MRKTGTIADLPRTVCRGPLVTQSGLCHLPGFIVAFGIALGYGFIFVIFLRLRQSIYAIGSLVTFEMGTGLARRVMSGVLHCLYDRSSIKCRGIASSIHEFITERSGGCPSPAARSAAAGALAGDVRGNFCAWADRI